MREILTYPIEAAEIREELLFVLEYFRARGHSSCEVLFGWAWGNDYYPTDEWAYRTCDLGSVLPEVERAEQAGWGKLGQDDLYLKFPTLDLEFRFCNDSDLHISFDQASDVVESFYSRWKARGFSPAEWAKRSDGSSPGERIRIN